MDALKGHVSPGAGVSAPDHIVQFYETDDYLASVVAGFLAEGLEAGQTTIAVATPVHRKAFLGRLRQKGFDLVRLRDAGRLVFLDARETLSTFMNGCDPDPGRFRAHFEPMLGRLFGNPNTTARAYGEMVDLLWQDENVDAALQLEALWNELVRDYPFTLLCSYALARFTRETHTARFHDVCRAHTHVIPAEGYSQTVGEEARAREVSRLQVRARALAAEAEAANRLKDEFLSGLSHELRTPLNAILGWAQIVRDPQTDESTIRRALDVIQRNASLQVHLIDELLDVSRIITGKLQLTLNRVNLATVLAGALDSVRPAATAKSISLQLEVDRSARFVQGDAARLHQVVWNLLTNAIKFTPDRGRIDVRLERDGSEARIVIRDTGQGIGRDFMTHVFQRFRQADTSTTRQHGGIGLGLTIVKYLVEAHGGRVLAESPGEGLGATFTVTLPLSSRGLEAVDDDDRAAPTQQTKAATLAGARLLVVDDEKDERMLVKHMMERAGAAVETAASAGEAIRLLSSASFDLLLADLGMPGQDGYALIAAIRSLPDPKVRRIPAVAVSAYAGHNDRAIVAGYDGYIEKPVDAARLEATASRLLTSLPDDAS